MNKKITILAIETSCDETSASLCKVNINKKAKVKNIDIKILSNVVSSQIKLHAKYGGVYPELASREHVKNILPVICQSLGIPNFQFPISKQIKNPTFQNSNKFDVVAVTSGPGLIGSLLVGVNTAKTLAYVFNMPIYSVNHLEGHIYSNFVREFPISNSQFPKFPQVVLIVSGGHTSLVYMKNHLDYKVIGETLDDAAGEAFDKVAKLLDLGYPGGPVISAMAEKFPIFKHQFPNKFQIKLPRPMIDSNDFNFSFSGLKTAVLYTVNKLPKPLDFKIKSLICKEFQNAVAETLVTKTLKAAKKYKAKSILLCGGVAANSYLRDEFKFKIKNFKLKAGFFVPEKPLCTDNAAMIGIATAYKIALGKKPDKWYDINADSNQKL